VVFLTVRSLSLEVNLIFLRYVLCSGVGWKGPVWAFCALTIQAVYFCSTASLPSKAVKAEETDSAFILSIKIWRALTGIFEHMWLSHLCYLDIGSGKGWDSITSPYIITDGAYYAYVEWLTIQSGFPFHENVPHKKMLRRHRLLLLEQFIHNFKPANLL